jgi:hypothetical protein
MEKGLPVAVGLSRAVLQSRRPTVQAITTSRLLFKRLALQPLVVLSAAAALVLFMSGAVLAQGVTGLQPRRIVPPRTSEVPEGSRVTIKADASLDDYTAYLSAGRFHVLIPQSELSSAADVLQPGRGFTDLQVERRGESLEFSFKLEPGVTASVAQKFNRLDVTFNIPAQASGSIADTARMLAIAASSRIASGAPSPISASTSFAQGETISLAVAAPTPSATPTPTPEPAVAPSSPGTTPGDAKPATVSSPSGAKPGIVLPAEKANPVTVSRFEKAPVIDGKLDDAVWQQAAVLKDFYQYRPGDNIAPSQPTEVLIGYDAKFIYFAFRAHDEAGKVRATVAKRDQVFDDDTVGMFLDTFNDRRRSYVMFFNPFGVQADGLFTEDQGEDYSHDIVMESKGVVTDDGYTVEVAIPFKSLRYEAGKGKLWGVHFLRQIKRLNNESLSWMPIRREISGTLSQAGHITGLEGISTERTLEIIPSLTISETGRRVKSTPLGGVNDLSAIDQSRFVNKPIEFDPGVMVKYGITSTVTLDLAINPDFAQVEADATVVTANQRFPIFFQEKRPFFLEGIDIFQTALTPVHTRAIVDPDFAVKLSGKRGKNSFGLLLASDNAPGNFSEDERTDPEVLPDIERFLDKNAYIGVLRLKRDIGKENSLGMIATSYNFIEKHNQLLGFDGRFRLDKQTVASFQVLGTTSRRFFFEPDEGRNIFRTGNALAYFARYDVQGRNFGWNYDGRGFTKDYRADVGFTRRTNTNRHGVFMYYNTDQKPKSKLIRQHYHILPEINFDWQGRIQSWGHETQTELTFPKQTYAGLGVSFNYERIFEEEFGATRQVPAIRCFSAQELQQNPGLHCGFAGDDSERQTMRNNIYAYGGTNPSKTYSLYFFTIHNWGAFDFDFGGGSRFPRVSPGALVNPDSAALDPGKGNQFRFEGGITYQPTNALRLSLDYVKDRLVRKDTGLVAYDDNIYTLRGTYQFTRFTFARARIDYDSLASSVRGQFLLGWAPNPGTSFYVGYNDDLNYNGFGPFTGRLEPGFRRNGRTFFIKMSYLFRRSF